MRKTLLALASAAALFGVAACSDSGTTDQTTTQSVPPAMEPTPAQPEATPPADQPMQPAAPTAPAQ